MSQLPSMISGRLGVPVDDIATLMGLVVQQCIHRFGDDGWTPLSHDTVKLTRPGSDEVTWEFAVNFGVAYELSLQPWFAIRHVEINRLRALFSGQLDGGAPLDDFRVPAFGEALRQLVPAAGPGGPEWRVTGVDQVDAAVARVRADVIAYGMPWFARYTTLDDVIDGLHVSRKHQYSFADLAIGLALAGRAGAALDALAAYADPPRRLAPPHHAWFRGFFPRYIDYFGYRHLPIPIAVRAYLPKT